MSRKPFTHLTRDDRVRIAEMLKYGESLHAIGRELKKSPSTIKREIDQRTDIIRSKKIDCINLRDCHVKYLCSKKCDYRLCKSCKIPCKKHCADYVQAFCDRLQESPYVCNGCKRINSCGYEKHMYDPSKADRAYRKTLSTCRDGYRLTGEQLRQINNIVSPLIRKKQSLYHIMQTKGDEIPASESTIRRMIHNRELDVRDIDMLNVVNRRQRPKKKNAVQKISPSKIGHLWVDYLKYMEENDAAVVQMDCVEGIKTDSAALLTLHFADFHMQLAMILDAQDCENVIRALDKLEIILGTDLFKEVFPVILTDNGSEFADIEGIERSINGGKRTKVFFCEPNRSDEKGACENNHKLIRYVIPKGTSLESFSQADINLMVDHINSYKRKSLFGRCPYEVAMAALPEDFFLLLGLEQIPPEEVTLMPSLLKKKAQ